MSGTDTCVCCYQSKLLLAARSTPLAAYALPTPCPERRPRDGAFMLAVLPFMESIQLFMEADTVFSAVYACHAAICACDAASSGGAAV
eukprot:1297250-Rhodomonas_salina.1